MELFPGIDVYLGNIAVLLALFFVCWSTGTVITFICFRDGSLPAVKSLQDHIFTGLTGLVFFLKSAFILGLMGFLNIQALGALVLLSLLAFLATLHRTRPFAISQFNVGHAVVFVMSAVIGLRSLIIPVGADDISYHLPYARAFVENHGLIVMEHLLYPLHTLEVNLLYAIGLMIDDVYFLKLLNISFICLVALLVYDYLQRRTSSCFALIPVIVLFSLENIRAFTVPVYVDFGFTLFNTLGVIAFLCWLEQRRSPQATFYLAMAALAVAEAASTKYFGLVFGFILFIFILLNSAQRIRDASLFLGICAVFGSGWYLRNIYYSGNPFHPFLSYVFGYHLWNAEDVALNLAELKTHGRAQSLAHYFTTIVRVGLAPVLLAWVSLAVSLYQLKQDAGNVLARTAFWLSTLSIVYSLFWYFSAHIDRYLLPVLALALSSATISLFTLVDGKVPDRVIKSLFTAVVILQLGTISVMSVRSIREYPMDRQDVMMRANVPGYALLRYASTLDFPGRRIYQIGFADRAYYYDGIAAGHWMGKARWADVADTTNLQLKLKPAAELQRYLQDNVYAALAISAVAIYDRTDLLTRFDVVYEDRFGLLLVPRK